MKYQIDKLMIKLENRLKLEKKKNRKIGKFYKNIKV